MARRIDEMPPTWSRSKSYPWDEWLDGSAWEIKRGEDFVIPTHSMQKAVTTKASSRGLRATTRLIDDNTLQFQCRKRDGGDA